MLAKCAGAFVIGCGRARRWTLEKRAWHGEERSPTPYTHKPRALEGLGQRALSRACSWTDFKQACRGVASHMVEQAGQERQHEAA